jgi:hypothetical protein
VHRELPKRVAEWTYWLQAEHIRGADLVFACIGPALEIYRKCSKVVIAENREIPLGGDPEARWNRINAGISPTLGKRSVAPHLGLFPDRAEGAPPVKGKRAKSRRKGQEKDSLTAQEATTLDRVHAAMLLQARGSTNGLRALLKPEQDRRPDFLRLAKALSALYPRESEEKRLLDAMLLAVPK